MAAITHKKYVFSFELRSNDALKYIILHSNLGKVDVLNLFTWYLCVELKFFLDYVADFDEGLQCM